MRLIDAEALEKAINEWMPKDQETWMESDIPPIENLVVSIMMTIEEQPTIEAIPIEFIEKRIAELKKLNEYEFIANGGYTSPSDYEQWELERLIRDWREQND